VTIVLNTNVMVAALVATGLGQEVVVRALGTCDVATSAPLLDELERTLRARFTIGPASHALLEQFRARLRIVEPEARPTPVSRDADDDVVLATALAARAGVIVTGDQDLLVIGQFSGIEIVSPRSVLTRLATRSP
jgi:uncharacterized protein